MHGEHSGAVNTSNFYAVCATVIPVLAVVQVAARPVQLDPVATEDVDNERQTILSWLSNCAWLITLAQWLLTGWAEFVCLRQLQTGHVASGGSVVVWIALAWTGAYIVLGRVMSSGWAINTGFRHMYHGLHGTNLPLDEPFDDEPSDDAT